MAEFGLELTVILAAPSGDQREVVALGDLLPRAFTPANLELPGPR